MTDNDLLRLDVLALQTRLLETQAQLARVVNILDKMSDNLVLLDYRVKQLEPKK